MAHNPAEYEKVKIAQELVGLDSGDQHFVMSAEEDVKERMARDAAVRFNDSVDEYTAKMDNYIRDVEEKAKSIAENMNGLEILPVFNYMIRILIKKLRFLLLDLSMTWVVTNLNLKILITDNWKKKKTSLL